MTTEGIENKDALKLIRKHDIAAAEYLKKIYNIDWDNPELYHLVINTDKVDFDRAAKIIADMIL